MKILRCEPEEIQVSKGWSGGMYEHGWTNGKQAVLAQMVDVDLEVILAGWHRHCYSLPYPSPLPTFEEYLKEQLGVKHDTTQP